MLELTENEIMSQAFLFLLAGFETTATTLTFIAHTLATKPDLQEKCFKEIQREFRDKDTVKNKSVLFLYHCIVLYCIVALLYCIVLYCIVLYCRAIVFGTARKIFQTNSTGIWGQGHGRK